MRLWGKEVLCVQWIVLCLADETSFRGKPKNISVDTNFIKVEEFNKITQSRTFIMCCLFKDSKSVPHSLVFRVKFKMASILIKIYSIRLEWDHQLGTPMADGQEYAWKQATLKYSNVIYCAISKQSGWMQSQVTLPFLAILYLLQDIRSLSEELSSLGNTSQSGGGTWGDLRWSSPWLAETKKKETNALWKQRYMFTVNLVDETPITAYWPKCMDLIYMHSLRKYSFTHIQPQTVNEEKTSELSKSIYIMKETCRDFMSKNCIQTSICFYLQAPDPSTLSPHRFLVMHVCMAKKKQGYICLSPKWGEFPCYPQRYPDLIPRWVECNLLSVQYLEAGHFL